MKVQLSTAEIRACSIKGCHNYPLFRHHKGNDKYLGLFNDKIRKKYWKFEHVCYLCDHHHMCIHFLYMRYLKRHKDWSPRGVRHLWHKLIRVCDRVIAGELRLPKPNAEFITKWQTSRENWLSLKAQGLR